MAKLKSLHRCSSCGATAPQWAGRCATCGDWNTLVEETTRAGSGNSSKIVAATAVMLNEVDDTECQLVPTFLPELDRVLGGGILEGSVTLLGGEPGIGKSTLVLQLCASMAPRGSRCLIVTGEESAQQVSRRAQRLSARVDNVLLLAETDVESILAAVTELKPDLVIVDSVQTMSAAGLGSAPGTVTQVRECAQAFVGLAKRQGPAVILIGHVTKEGALAGPRVLEHVVDTVLEFEGDRHHGLRFLRASKHRFGATDEVGVLEMTEKGLQSVADASGMFLDDRRPGIAGSVVVPTLQGRRPMLVELQTLINETKSPQPRRVAQGLDSGRFSLILAVLERRAGFVIANHDVFATAVGGVKVDDPGSDLPLALAVASSMTNKPLADDLVAIGEVGLGGEVRKVGHMNKRLAEVARMGFRRAIVPQSSPDGPKGLELLRVSSIQEAIRASRTEPATVSKPAPRTPKIEQRTEGVVIQLSEATPFRD